METAQPSRRPIGRRTALQLAGAAACVGLDARAARAATEAITLAIWTGYPELVPVYKTVSDAYTKANPAVKFTIFSTTLRELEQKLTAAMPTGTGPDIFDVGTNITVNFAAAGLISPNPPDIDQYLKADYRPESVQAFTMQGGKTYGLPFLFSTPAMFWNKAMFKQAGIAGPPQTFSELMDDARKLVKFDASGKMVRSGISLRLSGQGSGIAEKFRFVLEPAGGSLIVRTAAGKYHQNYDSKAGREALQFYIDAVQKYHVDDPRVQHDADAFVAGNTAMLFREAWVIGQIEQNNPKLDYGATTIPRWAPGMPKKTLLQQDGINVSGKSRHQRAAWDFVRFLTSPENSLKLTEISGWVAARQKGIDWSPLLTKIPQYEVFLTPPKDLQFYLEPVLPPWDEIETRLAEQLSPAYVDPALKDNPKKVAAAVHRFARQTDQLLKESDLYAAT